jgi:hypothetical protein
MRYGITGLQWMQMAKDQNWFCAICVSDVDHQTLVTDHDHETGTVRGLLCNACNFLIGLAKENPINLVSAAVYLQRNGKQITPMPPARNSRAG